MYIIQGTMRRFILGWAIIEVKHVKIELLACLHNVTVPSKLSAANSLLLVYYTALHTYVTYDDVI